MLKEVIFVKGEEDTVRTPSSVVLTTVGNIDDDVEDSVVGKIEVMSSVVRMVVGHADDCVNDTVGNVEDASFVDTESVDNDSDDENVSPVTVATDIGRNDVVRCICGVVSSNLGK